MPRTDDGTIADFCITTASVINRMNPGQFYEQDLNALSRCVQKTVREMKDINKAYEYIMGYIEDVRPVLREEYEKTTINRKEEFVETVRRDGIMLAIGFMENITPEWILYMKDKYGLKKSPLTYTVREEDGTMTTVRTLSETIIGDKHLMLLGKIPTSMLHCVEISYGNQFETPMKPTSKYIKSQSPVGQTCQRLGEDEICMSTMSMGAYTIVRLMGVNGNSPSAVKLMERTALTDPHPTQVTHYPMETDHIIKTSNNISIFTHMMAPIGYDTRPEADKVRQVEGNSAEVVVK